MNYQHTEYPGIPSRITGDLALHSQRMGSRVVVQFRSIDSFKPGVARYHRGGLNAAGSLEDMILI